LKEKAMSRAVTEDDLRFPEFRGVKLEQLEIREDGKVVRKDRFETAMNIIAGLTTGTRGGWECDAVVEMVRGMCEHWNTLPQEDFDVDYYPKIGTVVEVKLEDDSVLRNVTLKALRPGVEQWEWAEYPDLKLPVCAWRVQKQEQEA
jgi:hypothetical protein